MNFYNMWILFATVMAYFIISLNCTDFQLIDKILVSYDKRTRPRFGGGPVEIKSQLTVASLSLIDEQTFTFTVEFYLRHWWNDPRLKFNHSTVELINTNTRPEEIFWTPLLTILNAESIHQYKEAVRTVLKENGDVYVSRRVKVKAKCDMDLSYYPMDSQTCHIQFESYAFHNEDLKLAWHDSPIAELDLVKRMKTAGYTVEAISTEFKQNIWQVGVKIEAYDNLIVYFKVKRTFLYFLYRAYVPTILLMIFNIASYWIPATAVPARVTLIVTTFLASTFILQSVSEQTVKVPYTTAMQSFMLVNVVLIVVSIVEFVFILFLKHYEKQKLDTPVKSQTNPGYVDSTHQLNGNQNGNQNGTVDKQHTIKKEKEKSGVSHKIDMLFRLGIPFMYTIYCVVYFTYYLWYVV